MIYQNQWDTIKAKIRKYNYSLKWLQTKKLRIKINKYPLEVTNKSLVLE